MISDRVDPAAEEKPTITTLDTPLVTSSLVSAVVQILHLFPSPHYKELSVGAWLGTVLSLVGPEPPATHIKELTLGGSTSILRDAYVKVPTNQGITFTVLQEDSRVHG